MLWREKADCLRALTASDFNAVDALDRTPATLLLSNAYEYARRQRARGLLSCAALRSICDTLMRRDVSFVEPLENGITYAHLAVVMNDMELLRTFVAQRGDVDALSTLDDRPLHLAMRMRNVTMQRELLALGAHADAGNITGDSLFPELIKQAVARESGLEATRALACLCAEVLATLPTATTCLCPAAKSLLSLHKSYDLWSLPSQHEDEM